jgi:hypothetical protein
LASTPGRAAYDERREHLGQRRCDRFNNVRFAEGEIGADRERVPQRQLTLHGIGVETE